MSITDGWETSFQANFHLLCLVVHRVSWVVLKRTGGWVCSFLEGKLMLSLRSSWGEGQPGCLAVHHLERWWHLPRACWVPRRFWWRVASDVGWFWSSCCRGQRFRPTRELQRWGIPKQRRGRLVRQLLHARNSVRFWGDDEHDRRGTEVQHGMIGSLAWPCSFLPFLFLTSFRL